MDRDEYRPEAGCISKDHACRPKVQSELNKRQFQSTRVRYHGAAVPDTADIFDVPVCLIGTNAQGKLHIVQDVVDQIRHIDKHMVIVAIAGKYRTGKSYLMNRLFGKNNGFPLGSTIESKTKGIWVWCRQHPVKPDCVLMLLDTEGIGDIQKVNADNSDNRLMTLTLLICSTFIYNVLSTFNEEALSRLQKLSASHFPSFVLALRDFCLDLEVDGQSITADEYLENYCLGRSETGATETKHDFNSTRDSIRDNFKKRACFTFERPCATKQLKKLELLTDEDLDCDFLEQTRLFVRYIKYQSPVKMHNGLHVTGEVLSVMIEEYLQEINEGQVPNVDNMFRSLISNKNIEASKHSIAHYEKLMAQLFHPPRHKSELHGFHVQSMQMAMDVFYQELGQIQPMDSYVEEVQIAIVKCHSNLEDTNKTEAMAILSKLLENMYNDIEKEMSAGQYHRSRGFRSYKHHINKLRKNFLFCVKDLHGKAEEVFEKFIALKESEENAIFQSDVAITDRERKAREDQRKARQSERKCEVYALKTEKLERQKVSLHESFQKKARDLRWERQAEHDRLQGEMDKRLRAFKNRKHVDHK